MAAAKRAKPGKQRTALTQGSIQDPLPSVVEGLSTATGEDYFRSLVRYLASGLGARFAFLSELCGLNRVRLLAIWDGQHLGENFEYSILGTPCEKVFEKGFVYFPSHVQDTFPKDRWLRRNGVESYLALALHDAMGRPMGHLGVMHDGPMPSEMQVESQLRLYSAHAAAELRHKRAEGHLREQTLQLNLANQRLAALHAVTVAANRSLDLATLAHEVVTKITEIFDFDATRIFLLNRGKTSFDLVAADNPGLAVLLTTIPRQQGILAKAVDTGEPLIFENIDRDPRYRVLSHANRTQKRGLKFFAVFPISIRDETVGVICCNARSARELPPEEAQLIATMAGQVGVAIENAQILQDAKEQAQELSALHAVATALSGTLDLHQILEKALNAILGVTGMDVGYIRLLEGNPPQLNLKVHTGLSPEAVPLLHRGHRVGGPSDELLSGKRSTIVKYIPIRGAKDRRTKTLAQGFTAKAWAAISSKERVVGIINVGTRGDRTFSRGQISLLEATGASLGVALENVALYQESQKREELQRIIKELNQDITLLDIDTLLQKLTENATKLFKIDLADIRILAGDLWQVKSLSGIDPQAIPAKAFMPEGRSEWIVRHRKALMIPDITRVSEIPGGTTLKSVGVRGYLGVPLFSRNGEVLGVLRALSYHPREFTEEEIDLLQQFANGAAVAIENTRLFEETQLKSRELEALVKMNRDIAALLDQEILLPRIAKEAQKLFGVDSASFRLIHGNHLVQKGYAGAGPGTIPRIPLYQNLSGRVIHEKRVLTVRNLQEAPFLTESRQKVLAQKGYRSYLGAPLQIAGRVIGLLNLYSRQERIFSHDEIQLIEAFANQAAISVQNAQLFDEVNAGREQMQLLSRRLVEAQETERRIIARELHDEVGQSLTALKLMLATGARTPDRRFQEKLHQAQGIINELMNRVRSLSVDLRPAMLDDFGLLPTLVWHIERYTEQTGVRVHFKHAGIKGRRFSPDLETASYRIIQEALTNAARHSTVSEVAVQVSAESKTLKLRVRDQGCGFNPKAVLQSGGGSGLGGMRERAVSLGGRVAIQSRPGSGTTLTATFSLKKMGKQLEAKGEEP